MKTVKAIELFGGIGAFTEAMKLEQIIHEVVDYVDFNGPAVKVYNAFNNTSYEPKDICQYDEAHEGVTIVVHGSPCKNFSKEGKKNGGAKGSGTMSSLMWETVRIVEKLLPEIVLWENVAAAKSYQEFEDYQSEMKSLGYTNYVFTINAKHFVRQNRNRVFTISSRIPLTKNQIKDLEDLEKGLNIKADPESIANYIREDYVGKYYEDRSSLILPLYKTGTGVLVRQGTIRGYIEANVGDLVDVAVPSSKTRRARVIAGKHCPTITTAKQICIVEEDLRLRYITALEALLFNGYTEEHYQKCVTAGLTENQIYERAGNTMAIPVMRAIVEVLFGEEWEKRQ